MALQTGQILNDRYRVVRLLAQGGFGAVYRAWDLRLQGPCALKENINSLPIAQKQFIREARLLYNLRHPNLPRVIDYFVTDEGSQYLVMDYIEGNDLQTRLDEALSPLPENDVINWIKQICDALIYLHAQTPPIVHRDIKPANIRITPQGQAILVDFGIAKSQTTGPQSTGVSRAVTPGYSPIEQYGRGSADPRSDIYSLGATMYTLLTGITPPESVRLSIGYGTLRPVHVLNPTISPNLSAVVTEAMQIQLNNRLGSAAEMKAAISGGALPVGEQIPLPSHPNIPDGAPATAAGDWLAPAPPASNSSGPLLHLEKAHSAAVNAVRFFPDGNALASASEDTTIRIWHTSDWRLQQVLNTPGPVSFMDSSPDSFFLAGSVDNTIYTWRVLDGHLALTLSGHSKPVTSLCYSPDGGMLASGGDDNNICIWRSSNGRLIYTIGGHRDKVSALAFSPHRRLFASASHDLTLRLWLVSSGKMLRQVQAHDAPVTGLTFSPDGELLVSSSMDGTLRVWRVSDGNAIGEFKAHRAGILCLAYSPGGQLLVSGGADNDVYLWRAHTARLQKVFKGHTGEVRSVAFSPLAPIFATASTDNTFRVYKVTK